MTLKILWVLRIVDKETAIPLEINWVFGEGLWIND
jgi:hypothetical protein